MAFYLWQTAYTAEAWGAQIRNPQNRLEVVRPIAERLGGRIVEGWFAFGEYDVVVILEMPDNKSMAALAVAAAAAGHLKAGKTTVLMTADEGLAALRAAGGVSYPAPSGD